MADVQKMLEALECHFKPLGEENCSECQYECSKASWTKIQDQLALDLIEFLKGQTPRVMTLAEACGAEVCWIEMRIRRVVTVCKVRVCDKDDYSAFVAYMLPYTNENISRKKYGKTWRCWTSRPTHAQREATPWN